MQIAQQYDAYTLHDNGIGNLIYYFKTKFNFYATKTTNIIKNTIKTANILIISHRFEVTD